MEHIFKLLPGVLQKRGLQEHAVSALVVHRARSWIAEQLPSAAPYLEVLKINDGTLFIACTHSIAAQECQAALSDLRSFLQQECPFAVIRDVRLARSTPSH